MIYYVILCAYFHNNDLWIFGLFCFFVFFAANEELLKAFGKSKDGITRLIKVSIEKGTNHSATIF